MSTLLAEQLRRLAAPQTANLTSDRKTSASILFDSKEAADKDRNTIYEIGLGGLQELGHISGTKAFETFRETLFDESAKGVERSVENIQVNDQINTVIRQFLYQLSPYFLLQPAHKCLEWMIRRFRIHEFNKDDFIILVLPYIATSKIAVKCIQTINLNDPNDRWNWLKYVQKSGQVMSKQTIVNHSVGQYRFLELVAVSSVEATRNLKMQGDRLQVN